MSNTNLTSNANNSLELFPPVHPPQVAGIGLWVAFCIFIFVALAADMAWGARRAAMGHHVRGAIVSSIAWLSLGFAFAGLLTILHDNETGLVFLTGYLVEKSLSVDNLVVIALVFRSFHIKPALQGPVLKWGIIGAIVFRAIFIFAGVALLERFVFAIYAFGALLLWSAYKMYIDEDDDVAMHEHTKGGSWMMRCLTLFIPYHSEANGTQFVEWISGRLYATPMLAALVVVELSDVVFAIDSIPCILGLTHDLFLVFSSNMLAILGLRSLYLLLAEALDRTKHLKTGLSVILALVGLKMMLGKWWPLHEHASLLLIFGVLGITVASSFLRHDNKQNTLLPS